MTMPGTHRVINGVEVVAFATNDCVGCDFGDICDDLTEPVNCGAVPPEHPSIIWLTPLNYIAHRLTQGTTP